jgi:hypothetical protein
MLTHQREVPRGDHRPPEAGRKPGPDAARPTTLPRRPAGGDRRRTLDLKRLNTTPDGGGEMPAAAIPASRADCAGGVATGALEWMAVH